MKKVVIVQARMGSTRLPGKVLLPLAGRPVLAHVVDRLRAVPNIDDVMIALPDTPEDDRLAEFCRRADVPYYRGSQSDVLSRYYGAAVQERADVVIRVTSDCPAIDLGVTAQTIQAFLDDRSYDYMSNTTTRLTFPRGLDTEVFTFAALEHAQRNAHIEFEREHVTPYIKMHPELFKAGLVANEQDWSQYRWTLDTPEDYELLQRIFNHLYSPDVHFSWTDVLKLMQQHPKYPLLNAHIEQKKLGE